MPKFINFEHSQKPRFLKLRMVLEHAQNSTNGSIHSSVTSGILTFKELGASLKTSGEIVFDVPEDDKGLMLEISGEGLFSDKMYVNIGDASEL